MKTIELFSGTKSFSKVAQSLGHSIYTIDNKKDFNPTLCMDILRVRLLKGFNLFWCSPPCTAFSVASIGKHWDKDTRKPKTENAELGLKIVDHTIKLIAGNKPQYWFIENPRGMLRKVIDPLFTKHNIKDYVMHTITYCQYGDERMKPTDIWTNCKEWKPKPPCKNGMPCHVSAPRGSRTGTQGIKGAMERGVIPPDVFKEIFRSIKE